MTRWNLNRSLTIDKSYKHEIKIAKVKNDLKTNLICKSVRKWNTHFNFQFLTGKNSYLYVWLKLKCYG